MKKTILIISVFCFAVLCNSTYAAEHTGSNDTIKGRVTLELVVTKEGKVRDPKVVQSMPTGVFDEAAIEAAKKLRFKPPIENGQPVEAVITKVMEFNISAAEFNASKASNDGIKKLKNGDCKNALSDFNAAIGLFPEKGRYYDLRGQAYYDLENYQAAIDDFSTAIEKEPDMVGAYFDRGEAFRKIGRYRDAIDDYSKTIALDNKYLRAYNSRAVSYNRLKDTENMCLDLRKDCELGDCRGIEAARKAEKCN